MAGRWTPRRPSAKARLFLSVRRSKTMNEENKTILLVEDNDDDVALTLRAFKRSHLMNPVAVVRDGVEALDFLFARGAYADRGEGPPTLVILDLKLPKLDGLGVLKAMRADSRTALLPTV